MFELTGFFILIFIFILGRATTYAAHSSQPAYRTSEKLAGIAAKKIGSRNAEPAMVHAYDYLSLFHFIRVSHESHCKVC